MGLPDHRVVRTLLLTAVVALAFATTALGVPPALL
jgi:hypothetical protein